MCESVLGSIDPVLNIWYPDNEICEYFTIDRYIASSPNFLKNLGFELQLLNFNIRSFRANGPQFEIFLDSLPKLPEFVVLTETWNSLVRVSRCRLEGFNVFHEMREGEERGGGVSIFCVNNLTSTKIDELSFIFEFIESCVIKVELYENKYLILIGIYRPPTKSIPLFMEKLNFILTNSVCTNAEIVVLSGDININLLDLDNSIVSNYVTQLNSLFFLPTITKATRFPAELSSSAPSNLDHIWINKLVKFKSGILDIDFTDHCPTFLHFSLPKFNKKTIEKIKIEFRPFSQKNLDSLILSLNETNWNSVLETGDPNASTENFISVLNEQYCRFFPVKTKYVSLKRLKNPWLNSHILSLIRKKSYYFQQFKLGLISKNTNNHFKNKVSKIILNAKNKFYLNTFDRYKTDIKKSWETIKNLIGQNNSRRTIKELIVNSTIYSTDETIAFEFNRFFSEIAPKLERDLPSTNLSPLSWMPPPLNNSFRLHPVTESECGKIIKNLKNSKTNISQMPVTILKLVNAQIVSPLSQIINMCFKFGVFPECLKIGRVVPIFKTGDRSDPTNYRPITILPYISKIFESSICIRLVKFFEKFSLLTDSQFGFRSKKSTCDALIRFVNSIYDSLDSKQILASILIDFRKAFDTISHDILIKKLCIYGIRDIPLRLIENYLHNRKQIVSVGSAVSPPLPISYGIPQGACLGPFLFLVYVNDLALVSPLLDTILFADDTTLSMSDPIYSQLSLNINAEIDKIKSWTISNRMSLNVSKTNALIFSNKTLPLNYENSLKIGNSPINIIDSCKFLGVQIDNRLSFKNHVKYVTDKISRNSGIFYEIHDKLPLKARLNYYYGFIYPYLTYNVIVWGNAPEIYIKDLFIQQKRFIRTLADVSFFEHTTPLFHRFELLKFSDIYKYYAALYMYSNRNNVEFITNHSLNTRNRNMPIPAFCRLSLSQNSIRFQGPKIWNDLPSVIRNSKSIRLFKKNLKPIL